MVRAANETLSRLKQKDRWFEKGGPRKNNKGRAAKPNQRGTDELLPDVFGN